MADAAAVAEPFLNLDERHAISRLAWALMAVAGSAPCPACLGTGERELPIRDGLDLYACPCCRPWGLGFPGEFAFGRAIIAPAEPGERAAWMGWR